MIKKQGFTLIELIIVMAILSILTAIATGAYLNSMKKGRDATRKANLRAMAQALDMYYTDNGRYPQGDVDGKIVGCKGGVGLIPSPTPVLCPDNAAFQNFNGTVYMQQIPKDPMAAYRYFYKSLTIGSKEFQGFQIYAYLENAQDPALITTSENCSSNEAAPVNCNWGVSSANTGL